MKSTEVALISMNGKGPIWFSFCVPAALSVTDGWTIGETDEVTALPVATKGHNFACAFHWSDADGQTVHEDCATHLAVTVNAVSVSEEDSGRELAALVERLESCRDGSFENLAMFNH